MQYRRVVLKLSGEALKTGEDLYDFDRVHQVAGAIREMRDLGVQLGVVIGAGNIWRGRQGPAARMDAVVADQMGMLGTVINCLCMADALKSEGVDAVVMSAVDINRFCEPFHALKAREYMEQGRVVLFACGSGNPFFSTDTAVVLRALEVEADAILMAKNVDGVYSADPGKHPEARLLREITYREALEQGLRVMDASAFQMCAERNMKVVRVFALSDPRNLVRVLQGDDMGTVVHP